MRTDYVPTHFRGHADSENVSCVGVDRKEPSLMVTNKQIHSLTENTDTQLYI